MSTLGQKFDIFHLIPQTRDGGDEESDPVESLPLPPPPPDLLLDDPNTAGSTPRSPCPSCSTQQARSSLVMSFPPEHDDLTGQTERPTPGPKPVTRTEKTALDGLREKVFEQLGIIYSLLDLN